MMFKNEGETFLPLEISTSLKFLLPNGVEGILLNERLTGNTDHKLVSFVFSNVAYTMILHVRLSLRSFCSCTVRSATTTTSSGPSPDPTDSTRLSLSSSASYSLLLHLIYPSLSWSAALFVVTFIPLFLSLAPRYRITPLFPTALFLVLLYVSVSLSSTRHTPPLSLLSSPPLLPFTSPVVN